jgi:hypothetical protein
VLGFVVLGPSLGLRSRRFPADPVAEA